LEAEKFHVYHILVYFMAMPTFQLFCHFGTVKIIPLILILYIFPCGTSNRFRVMASPYGAITPIGHTTLGMTLLNKRSARHRKNYLTTHKSQKRKISMHPGGIWTRNPRKPTAADTRLSRPRGHRDRHYFYF